MAAIRLHLMFVMQHGHEHGTFILNFWPSSCAGVIPAALNFSVHNREPLSRNQSTQVAKGELEALQVHSSVFLDM